MKIHEYQAKELLISYGVPAQSGIVAENKEEAKAAAEKLGGALFVVKAQIHSGGRGKAGGVKLAKSADEAAAIAEKMIGSVLVSKQTGPEGKRVNKVLVTKGVNIEKEYYLSITMDNASASPVIIASAAGGTEIEEVAATSPEKIITVVVPPETGLKDYHAREVAAKMGIEPAFIKGFSAMLKNMYKLFIEKDCSLIEINPLVKADGELFALDAKVNFDDNAIFRHPDIAALRDKAEEDAKEAEAAEYDLNYVALDGDIGCMVNGAGLAMATMDIIKACGGRPANFLDVGGSATAERVAAAFRILLSDAKVKAILVNIFGGIMKCDVIAEGIVKAAKEIDIKVPLVVRLDGTNVARGKEILKESGLKIIAASDLGEAARLSVEGSAL